MKITLEKVTVEEVEMELPNVCPNCKHDFADGGLTEEQLIGSSQAVASYVPDDITSWDYEESEYCSDICHVVGYRCSVCGHQLITTESE